MSDSGSAPPLGLVPPPEPRTASDISAHLVAHLQADPAVVSKGLTALRECLLAWESFRLSLATFMGVTLNEGLALSHLAARGPLGVGELQTAMGFTNGATSLLVDRLEEKGLVERLPDPLDRRKARVRLLARSSDIPLGHQDETVSWLSVVYADMSDSQVEATTQALAATGQRLAYMAELVAGTEGPATAPRRRF